MTAEQARMARALLQLGVREVGEMAGVTPNTISRIENGSDAKQSTIAAIRAVYEGQGVRFLSTGDSASSATVCRVAVQ